jgi:hypothetical protein
MRKNKQGLPDFEFAVAAPQNGSTAPIKDIPAMARRRWHWMREKQNKKMLRLT